MTVPSENFATTCRYGRNCGSGIVEVSCRLPGKTESSRVATESGGRNLARGSQVESASKAHRASGNHAFPEILFLRRLRFDRWADRCIRPWAVWVLHAGRERIAVDGGCKRLVKLARVTG
jgi:hypothetical protein